MKLIPLPHLNPFGPFVPALAILSVSALGIVSSLAADPPAEKPKPPTYLTVETAGRDYPPQGEYLNDWGGAQIIALGDDNFRMVTLKGGLTQPEAGALMDALVAVTK